MLSGTMVQDSSLEVVGAGLSSRTSTPLLLTVYLRRCNLLLSLDVLRRPCLWIVLYRHATRPHTAQSKIERESQSGSVLQVLL